MDASSLAPDAPLPDDVPTLQALVRQVLAEVAQLRAENAELRGKLDAALKHRFGRRSERQLSRSRLRRRTSRAEAEPHGRSPLPEHLERREVVHDLTEAEKLCPCCGQPRVCIGEQTAEQLDLEPARFFVLRTVKKSYACRHCDPERVPAEQRLQTAGPAEVGPIAKGLCGPGLLAHVITAKFADHIPLHRLAGQLARSGVRIARSTLGDWLAGAAELLDPLVPADAPAAVAVAGDPRRRHRGEVACAGAAQDPEGAPVGVHRRRRLPLRGLRLHGRLHGGRAGTLPARLPGLSAGRRAGAVRGAVRRGQGQARLLLGARPPQVRGGPEGGDERAQAALAWIGQLYAIERELPPLLPPSDDPGRRSSGGSGKSNGGCGGSSKPSRCWPS